MSAIEKQLEQVWGVPVTAYCTSCGAPVMGVQALCGHKQTAAWHDLTARQKTAVRRLAIARARMSAQTAMTAAS